MEYEISRKFTTSVLGVVHVDEAVGRDREGVGRQQEVVNRELATSVAVNS